MSRGPESLAQGAAASAQTVALSFQGVAVPIQKRMFCPEQDTKPEPKHRSPDQATSSFPVSSTVVTQRLSTTARSQQTGLKILTTKRRPVVQCFPLEMRVIKARFRNGI